MPEVATPNQAEREFETGTDEFFKGHSQINALNNKRTFDEYQDLALTSARRSQSHFDTLSQLSVQALQNAVETANMVGKQAVKHADIAADAMWNPIQQGSADNLTAGAVPANRAIDVSAAGVGVSAEAVAAAVAKQVDATITPVLATLQQLIQALATATTSIANTVNQTQPKS